MVTPVKKSRMQRSFSCAWLSNAVFGKLFRKLLTHLPSRTLAGLVDRLRLDPYLVRRLYPLIINHHAATSVLVNYLGDPPEVVESFQPLSGQVVVDVGAHMGAYTILAANLVGTTGKVIAVEAHPSNFGMLLKNVRINSLENVVPVNVAAADYEGHVKLHTGKKSGWHSIMSDRHEYLEDNHLIVPCVPLDRLLAKLGVRKVDWMKIDVEGAELCVLRGLINTLNNNSVANLIIEVHSNKSQTMSYLKSFGFDVKIVATDEQGRLHVRASYDRSVIKSCCD